MVPMRGYDYVGKYSVNLSPCMLSHIINGMATKGCGKVGHPKFRCRHDVEVDERMGRMRKI
jgi:hypothetical protein